MTQKEIRVDVDTFTYGKSSLEFQLYNGSLYKLFDVLTEKHKTTFVTFDRKLGRFVVEVPVTHRNATTRVDGPGFTHDR